MFGITNGTLTAKMVGKAIGELIAPIAEPERVARVGHSAKTPDPDSGTKHSMKYN